MSSSPDMSLRVCTADYTSHSSAGSSPHSRRNSVSEVKDDEYWERRRKNNEASRRSREKRRINDCEMEKKLRELAAENERLKAQLDHTPFQSRTVSESRLHVPTGVAAMPAQQHTAAGGIATPPSLPTASALPPHLQMCQLQALQNQLRPSIFSSTSAFQPVNLLAQQSVLVNGSLGGASMGGASMGGASMGGMQLPLPNLPMLPPLIVQPEIPIGEGTEAGVIRRHGVVQQAGDRPPSLLSALLARRTSPTIIQTNTELKSRLASPPRSVKQEPCSSSTMSTSSRSDSDSMSYDSHSPTASGEEGTPTYCERRRRNNEAAKRCRANRRAVFEYRSRRVQILENENDDLKSELAQLRSQVQQYRAELARQQHEQ